jgi:hypothetical protein
MSCLWRVHSWHMHVTCWKAPSVEAVGTFSSGPGRVVGEIVLDKADDPFVQGYIR